MSNMLVTGGAAISAALSASRCQRKVNHRVGRSMPPQLIVRSSSADRVDGKLVAFLLFRTHHSGHYLCKAAPVSPAELPSRLRGVAPRIANVSGTSERIIAFNVVLPSQSNFGERGRHEFLQPVGYTRSDNKILGPIMLKHHPHRFYVVRRPAPVAMNRNIPEL